MSADVSAGFARMAAADYNTLIAACLREHDMEGVAAGLHLMAIYHPHEAQKVLDAIDLAHAIHRDQP